jgi:hypothetical protein
MEKYQIIYLTKIGYAIYMIRKKIKGITFPIHLLLSKTCLIRYRCIFNIYFISCFNIIFFFYEHTYNYRDSLRFELCSLCNNILALLELSIIFLYTKNNWKKIHASIILKVLVYQVVNWNSNNCQLHVGGTKKCVNIILKYIVKTMKLSNSHR